MASGKSAVGRQVSRLSGAPFVDLDEQIESVAGTSVAEIFQTRGESEFRELESNELRRLLAEGGRRVVAVGGGALLRREARLLAMDEGVVVTLRAGVDEVLANATRQPRQRPLLSGSDPRESVARLLELRELAYSECHASLATKGRSPEELAAEALRIWGRQGVGVAAGSASYAVEVGSGMAPARLAELAAGASRIVLVTDTNVAPLHAEPVRAGLAGVAETELVVLRAGEAHKTLASVERVWRAAQSFGADRGSLFVALGGGVVTDMAGMAAAGWLRGVRWLAAPTTLLAMVDASVGGKTGVDLGLAKNAVGAFWQPSGVVCDTSYLKSEPRRGLRGAIAEVVKTALIGDADLLAQMEQAEPEEVEPQGLVDWVRRCVRVKARVVGLDAREGGIRASLNLGHTLGHAFESAAGLGRLAHGEAVSLGLVAALQIGVRLGVTSEELAVRVEGLLRKWGLPTDWKAEPIEEALALLELDKKRSGSRVRFVLVRRPEAVEFQALELADLRRLVLSLG